MEAKWKDVLVRCRWDQSLRLVCLTRSLRSTNNTLVKWTCQKSRSKPNTPTEANKRKNSAETQSDKWAKRNRQKMKNLKWENICEKKKYDFMHSSRFTKCEFDETFIWCVRMEFAKLFSFHFYPFSIFFALFWLQTVVYLSFDASRTDSMNISSPTTDTTDCRHWNSIDRNLNSFLRKSFEFTLCMKAWTYDVAAHSSRVQVDAPFRMDINLSSNQSPNWIISIFDEDPLNQFGFASASIWKIDGAWCIYIFTFEAKNIKVRNISMSSIHISHRLPDFA